MRSLLVLVALTSLASAATIQQVTTPTLDVLAHTGHTILVSLIKAANMTSLFDGSTLPDTYTLFAPQDRNIAADLRHLGMSLNQLKNDTDMMKDFINYHIIRGAHDKNTFFNDRLFTTLNGAVIRTNHYIHNNNYYVDGSVIQGNSYNTQTGMVHTIRHLLNPIKGNIYDTIALDPQLSTLKSAIDAAGLEQFLRDQNPITVFAPTDAAFGLLGSNLAVLMGKTDLLTDILDYHVVYGSLYAGGMHDETLHTFEEKDKITLDIGRFGTKVDDARFVTYDISASNGVIHKITSVLIPDDLKAQL